MKILTSKLKEKYATHYRKLSYSKFKNFKNCESSWLIGNFIDSNDKVIDQRYAVSGTIIQRIFQSIINEQKYNQFKLGKDLKLWIRHNVYALSEILIFPLEFQYEDLYKNRDFYSTATGKELIEQARKKYPYFDITTDIHPNFVNLENFKKDHNSLGAFAEKISKISIECCFNFLKIDLKSTTSEVYLKYEMPSGLTLSGIVDFIEKDYKNQPYFIFDGKANLNSYVDNNQLIFYSYLIYKNYGTYPYKTGFLGWTKNEFKEVSVDQSHFEELEKDLIKYEKRCLEIKEIIESINVDYIELTDLLKMIEQTPSYTNCNFCSIKEICPSAYKSKKQTI